ncbi:MAG: regulatory protein RecX [Methylococcales bacterium]|nr:regulatory protein RecX [Methylococcales bacterium]
MNSVAHDIKNHCLRLLARREHSQKELLTKLMQKGFSPTDIQPVIAELAQNSWQSDARFAENYARARLRKGYGATAIRYELTQKGIDVADTNLNDVLLTVADNWLDLLTQTYCKKYGEIEPLTRQDWAKRTQFLLRRRFSSSQIQQFDKNLRFIHS